MPIEEAVAGVDRLALVLGSEGHGLSSRWEASADRRAIIPMRAGIDSLNVAAATRGRLLRRRPPLTRSSARSQVCGAGAAAGARRRPRATTASST